MARASFRLVFRAMEARQSFLGKLFSWQGEVGRGFYLVAGLVLFGVKWNIDRLVG